MGRIARPMTVARANQAADLERRETDRRVSAAAESAVGVVARHAWSYTNSSVASGSSFNIPSWTRLRDDGFARVDGGGIYLTPGRWGITAMCYSDAGAAARAAFAINHPAFMDTLGYLQDLRWRGAGFSGAGALHQVLSWTGPVSEDDAGTPIIAAFSNLIASGTSVVNLIARLQANYLGPATFADVGGYEDDPTS